MLGCQAIRSRRGRRPPLESTFLGRTAPSLDRRARWAPAYRAYASSARVQIAPGPRTSDSAPVGTFSKRGNVSCIRTPGRGGRLRPVFASGFTSYVARFPPAGAHPSRASPKSQILRVQSAATRRLPGLRSRCSTLAECRYLSPLSVCAHARRASRLESPGCSRYGQIPTGTVCARGDWHLAPTELLRPFASSTSVHLRIRGASGRWTDRGGGDVELAGGLAF